MKTLITSNYNNKPNSTGEDNKNYINPIRIMGANPMTGSWSPKCKFNRRV